MVGGNVGEGVRRGYGHRISVNCNTGDVIAGVGYNCIDNIFSCDDGCISDRRYSSVAVHGGSDMILDRRRNRSGIVYFN